MKWLGRLVFGIAFAALLGVALVYPLANTWDLGRTFAYVLLVESPALILLVVLVHGYAEWEARR